MPKKTKTIFIITFAIIIIGLVVFYFIKNKNANPNVPIINSIYQTFNPFGGGETIITTQPGSNVNKGPSTETQGFVSKFTKLTEVAVSGAVFVNETRPIKEEVATVNDAATEKPKPAEPKYEEIPSVRYVEKATGHISQLELSSKKISKISNSTIPGIHEALFDAKTSTIIYRYLSSDKSINTFMATLGAAEGEFLAPNITDVSISPDKSKFFYLIENMNGVTGTIGSFVDTKRSQVFSSSFSEWLSQWSGNQNIFLTTKPSYSVKGSMFKLNVSTNSFTKVLGGITGLTTLANNDGSLILYGSSLSNGPRLGIFNPKDNSHNDLYLSGLPEKCVWSTNNIDLYCATPNSITGREYPDSWYQGLVSFDDMFIKIDTQNNTSYQIGNSIENTPIDATYLFLDDKEETLFFINKKDSTLWSLTLN